MRKVFKYFKATGVAMANGEFDGYEGYEFEYGVDEDELIPAIVEFMCEDYFSNVDKVETKKGLTSILRNSDNLEHWVYFYENDLKEYFEERGFKHLRGISMSKKPKEALPMKVEDVFSLIGKTVYIKNVGLKEVGAVYVYANKNGVVSVRIRPYGEQEFYDITK